MMAFIYQKEVRSILIIYNDRYHRFDSLYLSLMYLPIDITSVNVLLFSLKYSNSYVWVLSYEEIYVHSEAFIFTLVLLLLFQYSG